jgi:hypothetical protein
LRLKVDRSIEGLRSEVNPRTSLLGERGCGCVHHCLVVSLGLAKCSVKLTCWVCGTNLSTLERGKSGSTKLVSPNTLTELATLEATHGNIDDFFVHLPYKCHQNEVASVGDCLSSCLWVACRVSFVL